VSRYYEQAFAESTKGQEVQGLTFAADGTMWFVEYMGTENRIAHRDAQGHLTETRIPIPPSAVWSLLPRGDGSVWFLEAQYGTVARLMPNRTVRVYPIGKFHADQIAVASDGTPWVLESEPAAVAHIDSSGSSHVYEIDGGERDARSLLSDRAGGVYFAEFDLDRVVHISLSGQVSRLNIPWPNCQPDNMTPWNGGFAFTCYGGPWGMGFLDAAGKFSSLAPERHSVTVRRLAVDGRSTLWYIDENRSAVIALRPDRTMSTYRINGGVYDFNDIVSMGDGVLVLDEKIKTFVRVWNDGKEQVFTPPARLAVQSYNNSGNWDVNWARDPEGRVWMTDYGLREFFRWSDTGVVERVTIEPTPVRMPRARPVLFVPRPNAPPPTDIHLTMLNCLADLNSRPKVEILKMNGREFSHTFLDGPTGLSSPIHESAVETAPGIWQVDIGVEGGNYELYAYSKWCLGQVMAAVLPRHRRSTSIALQQLPSWNALFDHDHGSFAVTIGVPGAMADLVDPDDASRTLDLDEEDGVFYADSLQRSEWLLRVRTGCCRTALFPVDMTGIYPGDFLEARLTAADVRKRLTFNSTYFSNAVTIATSAGHTWYVNGGRSSIGYIDASGTHKEFSLEKDVWAQRAILAADDVGGVWFADWVNHRLGHVDADGTMRDIPLPGAQEGSVSIFSSGESLWITLGSSGALYRADRDLHLDHVALPANVNTETVGWDSHGLPWFNVNDRTSVAFTDSSGVHTTTSPTMVQLAPNLAMVGAAFLDVPINTGHGGGKELVGVKERHSEAEFSGYAAVRDGTRIWMSDCFGHRLALINGTTLVREISLPRSACPEEIAAYGSGGLWYREPRSMKLTHVALDGQISSLTVPGNALPFDLRVDATGALWFIESGANRIAAVRDGRIVQYDLGNPGATPHLTLVP
jgi:virginiamycin B lyase